MAGEGIYCTWQKNGINLDHDYPPLILKKRRQYTDIRKVLKGKKKVQFQTLFPARLRVRHEDGAKTYDTIEEAAEDLLRRGNTVTTTGPPETLLETWRRADRRARRPKPDVSQATRRRSEPSGDLHRHPLGPKGSMPSSRTAESRVKSV